MIRVLVFYLSVSSSFVNARLYSSAQEGTYRNWLKTVSVGGPYERLFQPVNDAKLTKGRYVQSREFRTGLEALIEAIGVAHKDGKRLRPYGSKWSSSAMPYTKEYMLETWGLNYCKVGIRSHNMTTVDYNNKGHLLVFVQAGVMVRDLNKELLKVGLALSTTGAGDGQRIAGAISTGTHGSAVQYGSMQEYVKAIHLVTHKGHFLLQRSSDQAMTTQFGAWLSNSTMILDDDMFNAALVSFGSFGIIHGLVLQAEPIYQLRMQSMETSYSQIKGVISSLDVSKLGFQEVNELPYHFEVTLNPYRINNKRDRGAFIRIFEKVRIEKESRPSIAQEGLKGVPDTYNLAAHSLFAVAEATIPTGKFFKRLIYGITVNLSAHRFFQVGTKDPLTRLPTQFFTGKTMALPETPLSVPSIGMELGVPLEHLQDALDVITKVLWENPIPTAIAIRYLKQSNATLGFTKTDGITATIEFPAPYGKRIFPDTGRVFDLISSSLVEHNVPHAYHWGQHFPVNKEWVEAFFGDRLSKWKEQRSLLLDPEGQHVFSNEVLDTLGF